MRYIIPCVLLALTTCLYADEPKSKAIRKYENEVEVLRKQGQAAIKRLEGVFEKEVEKLRETTLKDLREELDAALEAKDLDKAVALREEIKAFENGDESGLLSKSDAEGKAAPASKKKIKKRIPRDAVGFKGHRYYVVRNPTNVILARRYAESVGGYLLRINSLEEQAFLENFVTMQTWIDGDDFENESKFVFSDGSKVDLSVIRWMRYPNNSDSSENLVIWGKKEGVLQHRMLGDKFYFIIEWDN
ncbi:MAG: C-type lectin domain-containing protein [Planctomycetota bacterium]|nr:C-type lectin domain-containing protein [Planctomycetota bacterium]